ncbi:LPS O-antigen chain length determinant protein WzzB [Scandinavium sp. V105_16]|uniref:Chain length determinant protein n=1 Tax=Scandinavium lactucae TaxID=3095028 RepID=A0AAJ2S292_9ENTR|nr:MULTISPECIES: LPS O-antigen chain length determinant protein WzzB [unclassified Scandinavium]MDX6020058.1 LPS O-antigen chain length determinant protein WzzB [Scandinavium sp. V105_16]MDX6031127.1 LPS O-antigen chain length determinant protein WzzB [Scandinavium sp. V105_12]
MTQDNNKSFNGRSNEPEQIDLIDLVMQIWRGKVTIMVCVVVAILLAVGYIMVAKEKWTSTALVTQPDSGQVSSYYNAMNILYGSNSPSVGAIQQDLITRFNSTFSALSESLDNQEEPEVLNIEAAVKGQSLPLRVSYVAQTAEEAQKTLAQYIQQVDDSVAKAVEGDLKANITSRRNDIEQSLTTQEKVVTEQKALRIAQISQALTIAEQSKIKLPQIQQVDQVSQDTMFMLGSDALSAMVKNEATRPLEFPGSYYQTRQTLLDVNNLMSGGKDDQPKIPAIHAYRYVMKPTLPFYRDSPKRAIILVLAVLLGGMVGAGVVLGRNALRNYQPKV